MVTLIFDMKPSAHQYRSGLRKLDATVAFLANAANRCILGKCGWAGGGHAAGDIDSITQDRKFWRFCTLYPCQGELLSS